ncbi:uncharacterized protein [Ptychodera flava]|uniref:uncharacterized protein n=1 Tax=Ptychodera flava TaxID=63121 RepID=UPI00396A4DBB
MMPNSSSTMELTSQIQSQNGGHQISAGNGDISSHPNESIAFGVSATGRGEHDPMVPNPTNTVTLLTQSQNEEEGHEMKARNGDIPSRANESIAFGVSATRCGDRERMVPNPISTITPLSQSQNEEEGHEMKARNGDIPSRANGHCNGEVRVISTQSRAPQHKRKSDRGDAAGPRCMSEENESKLRELKPKLAEDMPYQQVLDRMSTVFTREDEAELRKKSTATLTRGGS